jgi:hypothetical protein
MWPVVCMTATGFAQPQRQPHGTKHACLLSVTGNSKLILLTSLQHPRVMLSCKVAGLLLTALQRPADCNALMAVRLSAMPWVSKHNDHPSSCWQAYGHPGKLCVRKCSHHCLVGNNSIEAKPSDRRRLLSRPRGVLELARLEGVCAATQTVTSCRLTSDLPQNNVTNASASGPYRQDIRRYRTYRSRSCKLPCCHHYTGGNP